MGPYDVNGLLEVVATLDLVPVPPPAADERARGFDNLRIQAI